MASRGCPYQCTYCNAALLRDIYKEEKGSPLRFRSVDNVIEELKWADREGRIAFVCFYDEIFGADIRWLRDFAPRYRREIGKPFLAATHPAHCTEEYAQLIKEAGCIKIDLGVQSTDPHIRKTILKRHETNEQIENAIAHIKRAGIFLQIENIFNLPGQDIEITKEMVRFYNRRRPGGIKIFPLRIYPRTPMEQIALEKGLITHKDVERNARGEMNPHELPLHGGAARNLSILRFQTLFSIMLFLKPNWVDYILDHELYRFLPFLRYGTLLSRLINAQKWEEDIMRRMIAERYKHHLAIALKFIIIGSRP
jgi:radical SAM superfamily enzyme YgiQ (UPF0313 family)